MPRSDDLVTSQVAHFSSRKIGGVVLLLATSLGSLIMAIQQSPLAGPGLSRVLFSILSISTFISTSICDASDPREQKPLLSPTSYALNEQGHVELGQAFVSSQNSCCSSKMLIAVASRYEISLIMEHTSTLIYTNTFQSRNLRTAAGWRTMSYPD